MDLSRNASHISWNKHDLFVSKLFFPIHSPALLSKLANIFVHLRSLFVLLLTLRASTWTESPYWCWQKTNNTGCFVLWMMNPARLCLIVSVCPHYSSCSCGCLWIGSNFSLSLSLNSFSKKNKITHRKLKVWFYLTSVASSNARFPAVFQAVLTNCPYQSPSALVISQTAVPSFYISFTQIWWQNVCGYFAWTLINKKNSIKTPSLTNKHQGN